MGIVHLPFGDLHYITIQRLIWWRFRLPPSPGLNSHVKRQGIPKVASFRHCSFTYQIHSSLIYTATSSDSSFQQTGPFHQHFWLEMGLVQGRKMSSCPYLGSSSPEARRPSFREFAEGLDFWQLTSLGVSIVLYTGGHRLSRHSSVRSVPTHLGKLNFG